MRELLHRLTRTQLIVGSVLALLVLVGALLAVTGSHHDHSAATSNSRPTPSQPTMRAPAPRATVSSQPRVPSDSDPLKPLRRTTSADVYAAEVASAMWNVDYAAATRDQLLEFWRGELAPILPIGTPSGTTLAQAQGAAMSTLDSYLPAEAVWSSLAHDRTMSKFTVTAVSEPDSWVAAVTSGKIADPGLTARTVVGIQTLRYGSGTPRHSAKQTQQITVAMLCPPTTAACALEILPPPDTDGSTG